MKVKKTIIIASVLISIIMGVGILGIAMNPITEGYYRESRGIEISSSGNHINLDVMERDDTVPVLHSSEDETNYIDSIRANESRMFDIRDFEERPPTLQFKIYFWDYSVESLFYNLLDNSTITVEVADVNITITTGLFISYWISAETAAINYANGIMGLCFICCIFVTLAVGYTMLPPVRTK